MADQQLQIPAGLVVVTTHGSITQETTQAIMDLKEHSIKGGLTNVQFQIVPGSLVDKARNDACRLALRNGCGWLVFIDADCVFTPDSLLQILQSAYGAFPMADVMGAWNPLRGEMALPTIDTGTGTWESHFPGSGVKEVMRTGGAYILIKRHVLERMKDPWFAMRVPARPVDFLTEIDNFARIKFDGRNPLRGLTGQPWEKLETCAQQDPSANGQWTPAEVGEDSGFCDAAKREGFRIFVNTDIACGHVDRRVWTWRDHKIAIENIEKQHRQCAGLSA